MPTAAATATAVRALTREDLDAVVGIDSAIEGRSRRVYFERRLAAALRAPKLHAQFAATDANGIAGYILARVLEGEFGRSEPGLRLETIGVRRDAQSHGIGRELLEVLAGWARRHDIRDLRTQATWNDHGMLRWLDAMGFALAPNHIVDCAVAGGQYTPERDDPVTIPRGEGPAQEIDYSAQSDNHYERLARDLADIRAMGPGDIADIVRIDRAITGRNRQAYMQAKLDEAMVDSAIRVSLTARLDEVIVGYLMASADLGDFGRTEPVAVIDTIGVDPAYAHRGVGHALLSQLFANLGRCGSSGSRRSSRRATSRCWDFCTTSGSRPRSGCRSSGASTDIRGSGARTMTASLPDDDAVREALRSVEDPEAGMNIVDLGLVYAVEVVDGTVRVDMTMTTAACPMADMILDQVRDTIRAIVGPKTVVDVRLVWDPPWTPDRMTGVAREHFGWLEVSVGVRCVTPSRLLRRWWGLPPAARVPLLILGFVGLVVGAGAGLARLGYVVPDLAAAAAALHGPLMICGFFGVVIALERAVAIGRLWAYAGPLLAVSERSPRSSARLRSRRGCSSPAASSCSPQRSTSSGGRRRSSRSP